MRPHPYLRAYMAGIVVPTVFLLAALTVYAYFRFVATPSQFLAPLVSRPLERAIIFPMAVVPNLWGAWNMLHLAIRPHVRLPLGVHGAILPLMLVPAGAALASALDVFTIPLATAAAVAPIGMVIYYVVWKHVVGYLNAEVGIAA